jgi:UPF0755 protein
MIMVYMNMHAKRLQAHSQQPPFAGKAGRSAHLLQLGGAFRSLLLLLLLIAGGLLGSAAWWLHQPLPLRAETAELAIEPGQTPRDIAKAWVGAGIDAPDWLLYQWFRFSGDARLIRAGNYEIRTGTNPRQLLRMMVRGDESLSVVRLIEGWTFRRFLSELAQAEGLKRESQGMSDSEIMAAIGSPGMPPEGQFFPDTYAYAKGTTDLAVLKRAHHAMQRQLEAAWQQREPNAPVQTTQQVLILASIIEKETGRPDDRAMISSVFHNRLRIGMRLQTDPTVIYGLGDAFDGNLRRVHLQDDTPFNTYTRAGLPPTPIAMPGKASLIAAVQPAASKALYFVARGDGSSVFSENLNDHNQAVNRYQRNIRKSP